MHFPPWDTLVIMLDIFNFTMQRLLVDNGSSTNTIFGLALEVIGINLSELDKFNAILISFDEKEIGSSSSIKLLVLIGGPTQLTSFLIIDTPSTYAILGKPWIHVKRAIPSTLH